MKILNVTMFMEFFVETDDPEFGGDYRRGEHGGWEKRMGESWEACYMQEDELEKEFQAYRNSTQI